MRDLDLRLLLSCSDTLLADPERSALDDDVTLDPDTGTSHPDPDPNPEG